MLSRIRTGRFVFNSLVSPSRGRSLHKRNMTSTANFKFAAIQLAVTSDKTKTLEHARLMIREAAKNGAQVISLPECFNCPYGTKYFPQYCESIPSGPTTQMLADEAKANKVFLIGGSFPEKEGDKLYNTSLSFSPDGSIIGKHRKVHLFDIDIPGKMTFKESESLSAGNTVTVLDTPFCRIGVAICYDVRFAELSMIMAQQHGCKMLVFPGAFNMTTGPLHWELLLRARAVDNQCFVAGVSPARDTSADYIAWGHSAIINPWAEVIAKADEKESIIYADIDFQRLDDMRNGIPITKQKRTDMYSLIDKSNSN